MTGPGIIALAIILGMLLAVGAFAVVAIYIGAAVTAWAIRKVWG